MRVTVECPECAYPVPVNGVIQSMNCHQCAVPITFEGDLGWDKITTYAPREGIRKTTGGLTLSPKATPVLDNYLMRPSRIHRRFEGILLELDNSPVACPACRSPQESTDLARMAAEGTTEAHCTACGAGMSLRSAAAAQALLACSCATPVALVGETAHEEGQASAPGAPVMFSCLACGAPLKIDGTTPRILECGYCQATSYMPDPLWFTFHPGYRKRPFFLLLDQYAPATV